MISKNNLNEYLRFTLSISFLAALTLTACQPKPVPLNPDSGATFGIYPVLHTSDGSRALALPDGMKLGADIQRYDDNMGQPVFVTQPAIVDETCLKSIKAENVDYAGPVLIFKLDERCTKIFGDYTSKHIGKQMALMLNGDFISAPLIQSAITGGTGSIDGGFRSLADAEALAKTFY